MFKSRKKEAVRKPEASSSHARSSADPRAASEPLRQATRSSREVDLTPEIRKSAPTGGVLSTLLKLYEQPQSERSSQATLVPSTASTPPESVTGSGRPVHGGGTHRAPEELAVPLSFANEVRRRGNLQLNSMFGNSSPEGNLAPSAAKQTQLGRHANGIYGALHQSNAVLTGAASPSSSEVKAPSKRPENGLK